MLDLLAEVTHLPKLKFQTPYAVAYAFGALDTARAKMFGGEPLAPLDAVKMAKYYMWFDSGKAFRELGYAPGPARQALAEAAAWFKANGYITREAALAAK
jgi:dihydroflavonol-4-reductase